MIFDLDGVLVDSKELHFNALNRALVEIDHKFKISELDHTKIYDGLSTKQKLYRLNLEKGLPEASFDQIFKRKQEFTLIELQTLGENLQAKKIIKELLFRKINVAVASNSVKQTVETALKKIEIFDLIELILSNEDVKNPKPHPEIYWKIMSVFSKFPDQTLIVEDSKVGRESALKSGAQLFTVRNSAELEFGDFFKYLEREKQMTNQNPWLDTKLNILIPMAGAGSRFSSAGYTFPKPLIEVAGQPMIQAVVNNLNIDANYIFITQRDHVEKYNLNQVLKLLKPNCKLVLVDGMTEGAASTTLLASNLIDNDNPLLIANSDQIIEWNSSETLYKFSNPAYDGGILTFKSTHPKWSYVRTKDGFVSEVAEKKPISDDATVGIYYWKRGSDYVKYAKSMIQKNIRTNGEFYVCPVFNEAIADNKKIITFEVQNMWGIGTPEDLNTYLNYGTFK